LYYVPGLIIIACYNEPADAPDGLVEPYDPIEKEVCASAVPAVGLAPMPWILKPSGFYWSAYGFWGPGLATPLAI